MEKKKKRDRFWQAVRGVCILAVVMIHCPDASRYASSSIEFYTWILLRQFIDFPVAVFFFMSGYFVKPDKVEQNPKQYVLKRGGIY